MHFTVSNGENTSVDLICVVKDILTGIWKKRSFPCYVRIVSYLRFNLRDFKKKKSLLLNIFIFYKYMLNMFQTIKPLLYDVGLQTFWYIFIHLWRSYPSIQLLYLYIYIIYEIHTFSGTFWVSLYWNYV